MCFKNFKIKPIETLIFELDCTKHAGIFCCTKEQWSANKLKIKMK